MLEPELDPPRTRWVGRGVGLAAGVALALAWQPYNLWPLLFVAVPALTLAVRGARPRAGFGIGYVFGVAFLALTVGWVHVLGWPVAAALVAIEALFFGVLGVVLAAVARLRVWPLAAAAAWVLVEFCYSRVPFGGFGWTRIAFAAVDTPLAGFFPFVGVAGVGFLVSLVGQLVGWLALAAWRGRQRRRASGWRPLVAVVGLLAVLAVTGGLLRGWEPEAASTAAGSVTVGVVQGNIPGRGIEAMGRERSVTNNHLSETVDLTARARLGLVPQPDFLLWPENSTDIDPLRDPQTHATVQAAASIAGRPILVGAVMDGPGPDERQTAALWWDPTRGVLARYNKRNLVPFGEYIPFRKQLLPLIPMLRMVGAQSVPGTAPGVLTVPVGARTIRVGDVICFELAYDSSVYSAVRGSQVLMVQSNNATYGGTGQIAQQFAITRARAMEARREIAVATTNAVSGFIDRDGRVVAKTTPFTAASLVNAMPLRTALTPALTVGPWVDRALAVLALVCWALALRRVAGAGRGSHRSHAGYKVPQAAGVHGGAVEQGEAAVPDLVPSSGVGAGRG